MKQGPEANGHVSNDTNCSTLSSAITTTAAVAVGSGGSAPESATTMHTGHVGGTGNGGTGLSVAVKSTSSPVSSTVSSTGGTCSVCDLTGACPQNMSLSPRSYETLARKIAAFPNNDKVTSLTKSKFLQRVKNLQWNSAHKRRRQRTGSFSDDVDMNQPQAPQVPLTLQPRQFTQAELEPTFNAAGILGCPHYQRGCKILAPCCGQLWTCRLCHDMSRERPCQEMVSNMDMYAVTQMLCMHCNVLQPVGQTCVNPQCRQDSGDMIKNQALGSSIGAPSTSTTSCSTSTSGDIIDGRGERIETEVRSGNGGLAHATDVDCIPKGGMDLGRTCPRRSTGGDGGMSSSKSAGFGILGQVQHLRGQVLGKYYCNVCKLWDNSDKNIYHCPYCNVCKVGKGLGQDFYHCMMCNCCVELGANKTHQCINQALEGCCPICMESLRFSTNELKGLPCAHVLHLECYKQYSSYNYRCPVCLKTMGDMSEYFSRLDEANMANGPMDQAFANHRSNITCNDCGRKSCVQYRMLYHKCPEPTCGSYNTRLTETLVLRPGDIMPTSIS